MMIDTRYRPEPLRRRVVPLGRLIDHGVDFPKALITSSSSTETKCGIAPPTKKARGQARQPEWRKRYVRAGGTHPTGRRPVELLADYATTMTFDDLDDTTVHAASLRLVDTVGIHRRIRRTAVWDRSLPGRAAPNMHGLRPSSTPPDESRSRRIYQRHHGTICGKQRRLPRPKYAEGIHKRRHNADHCSCGRLCPRIR